MEEFREYLRAIGVREEDAAELMGRIDADRSGSIEFNEVCAVIAPLYDRSSQALRRSFDFFDADTSGFIDLNELEVLLCQLKMLGSTGSAEAARIFAAADTNGDGKVSFVEFVGLFDGVQPAVLPQLSSAPD